MARNVFTVEDILKAVDYACWDAVGYCATSDEENRASEYIERFKTTVLIKLQEASQEVG